MKGFIIMKEDIESTSPSKSSNSKQTSISKTKLALVLLTCALWYFLSSFGSILDKKLLHKFPYPMTITLSNFTSSAIYSIPLIFCLRLRNNCLPASWRFFLLVIVPLAAIKVLAVSGNHIAVWLNTVSFSQTVKASMPIFTVIICRLLLKERQSFWVYSSLVPIVVGVGIATVTETGVNYWGLLASILTTIGFSVENIFKKKVIVEKNIHAFELFAVLARLGILIYLPIWATFDLRHIEDISQILYSSSPASNPHIFGVNHTNSSSLWHQHGHHSSGVEKEPLSAFCHHLDALWSLPVPVLLLLTGITSFLSVTASYWVLSSVSKLSYAVASATDRIFIIVSSLIFLGNPVTPMNISGMICALAGVFIYSFLNANKDCRGNDEDTNKEKDDSKSNKSTLTSISSATSSNTEKGDNLTIFDPNGVCREVNSLDTIAKGEKSGSSLNKDWKSDIHLTLDSGGGLKSPNLI